MVLIFGKSVLKATFPSAKHRVLGTGLARLQKVRERKKEREGEKESLFGAVGKSVCPALVCLFCRQSVTLSAQHCTSLIHCTVCLVSTDAVHTCLSFPPLSGHFSVQVCHLASPLPSHVFSDCSYSFGLHQGHLGLAEPCCHSQPHP